jgi:uncharacterized protein YecE (DUF72 family)
VIYAGSSGYSFKEWVGTFYPPKTKAQDFLPYYASELTSVEINHTFRRFPRMELIESWAEATPESFRFSFKMHQSVTHMSRLKNVGASVRDFMDALMPLGPRLGVVLFQLPPFFRSDLERLDGFLKDLPRGHRYAMEFRHESWADPAVETRLREAGVALAAAEVEIEEAPDSPVTAPFAYVRLRKTPPYSLEETERAADLVKRLSARVADVYLYVKHDDGGLAPQGVKAIVERAASAT